jgi:hypothetical protein
MKKPTRADRQIVPRALRSHQFPRPLAGSLPSLNGSQKTGLVGLKMARFAPGLKNAGLVIRSHDDNQAGREADFGREPLQIHNAGRVTGISRARLPK